MTHNNQPVASPPVIRQCQRMVDGSTESGRPNSIHVMDSSCVLTNDRSLVAVAVGLGNALAGMWSSSGFCRADPDGRAHSQAIRRTTTVKPNRTAPRFARCRAVIPRIEERKTILRDLSLRSPRPQGRSAGPTKMVAPPATAPSVMRASRVFYLDHDQVRQPTASAALSTP